MKKMIILTCLMLFTALTVFAVQFSHEKHYKALEGEPCATCHAPDNKVIVPSKSTCANCHDDDFMKTVTFNKLQSHKDSSFVKDHKKFTKIERYNCSSCHEQSFCSDCHNGGFANEVGKELNSGQNPHGSEFIVGHPLEAKENSKSCQSCHQPKFCSDCHSKFSDETLAGPSHRKSWSNLLTSDSGIQHSAFSTLSCQTCHSDSLTPTHTWGKEHARDARRNLATCQSCHSDGDTCLKCHSAKTGLMVNPHPKNWNKISGNLREASKNRTCRKCHN